MAKTNKVITFLGLLVVIEIIIIIFAFNRGSNSINNSVYLHKEELDSLNMTIRKLKSDIARYEQEINRINLERDSIEKEVQSIISQNEKKDSELANGDIDYNIQFLTEYLSKKDSLGK